MEFTAAMIASFLGGEVEGDAGAKVTTIAKIEEGAPGALSFLSNPKYEQYIYDSESSIVIVSRDFVPSRAVGATMVRVDDPYGCFAKLLELYASSRPMKSGIATTAVFGEGSEYGDGCYFGDYVVVGEGVRIGKNCKIYPHVFLDDGVRVGDNVTLYSGVKIYEGCRIGSNVIVHSGAVIGADGFGFAPREGGGYDKIPQIGAVEIGDDVEIGANCCIDRATMGATVIERGVKLDNLIQIAHNVRVGADSVFAAQVSIGANQNQYMQVIREAEAYPGPSLIIAYAPCINHGLKGGMTRTPSVGKDAVECGYWHLWRFNPALESEGKNPFVMESKAPDWSKFQAFLNGQVRYTSLKKTFPAEATELFKAAEENAKWRYNSYLRYASLNFDKKEE